MTNCVLTWRAVTSAADFAGTNSYYFRSLKGGEEPQVLYNVACVYALLGERDKAIHCLEKSVTRGWGQREWMEHDPDLASLRDYPRFQQMLKRESE